MRFYKNIDGEDFVDFLSAGGGESDTAQDETDKNKGRKSIEKDFLPLVPAKMDINKEKINLKINRNEDVIESIDIECECGNTIRLVMDYGDE